jgi:hypothetical protein
MKNNLIIILLLVIFTKTQAQVISGSARSGKFTYEIDRAIISIEFPFPTQLTREQKDSAFIRAFDILSKDEYFYQKKATFDSLPKELFKTTTVYTLYGETDSWFYPTNEYFNNATDYPTMASFSMGIPPAPELPYKDWQAYRSSILTNKSLIFKGETISFANPGKIYQPRNWSIPVECLKNKDIDWHIFIKNDDSTDVTYVAVLYYRIPPRTYLDNYRFLNAVTFLVLSTKTSLTDEVSHK